MENLIFIEAVRNEPCLWNPHYADYREMKSKERAWKKVVEHCNNTRIPNVTAAKAEWKKLRDNHRDALKRAKLGKNKLLPAQITTWKYAKNMQFLEPHMKYRITECIEGETSEPGVSADYKVSYTDNQETINNPEPIKSEKTSESYENKTTQQESDSLKLFFDSMLQSTRQMPLWMQTQVKRKLFAIILDAEDQLALQRNDETTSNSSVEININEQMHIETVIKSEVIEDENYSSY